MRKLSLSIYQSQRRLWWAQVGHMSILVAGGAATPHIIVWVTITHNPQDHRAKVGQLQPMEQMWPVSCFSKQTFTGTLNDFICLLSLAAFMLWQSSITVKETLWAAKPKIITIRTCHRQQDRNEPRFMRIAKPSTTSYWMNNLRHITMSLTFRFLPAR